MAALFSFGSGSKSPAVLVVDDDPVLQMMLAEVLKKAGYGVLQATNGNDGLSLARSKQPQLILLDMVMPSMGGLETLKNLAADPKTKGIPVIMVTSEQKGKDVETCFGWGAVGYVIKPVRPETLLEKVRQALAEKPK